MTETPSAVFHYSAVQDSCNSKHIDAIVEAAKKDLSSLMKLDVSYCKGTGFASAFYLILPRTEKWVCLTVLEMGWMFYSTAS